MITMIKKFKKDHKLELNSRPPPWPENNSLKIIQENTQHGLIDNSNPCFNYLISGDLKNSQLTYEEEQVESKNKLEKKEENKNSEEFSLYKFNPLNDLNRNKKEYQDDNLEFELNNIIENKENEPNFANNTNLNTFPYIKSNADLNLIQNISINQSLQKYQNLNKETNKNNQSNKNIKVINKMFSNKLQRNYSKSKNKNKSEINQIIKSTKMIYKNYFANFIKEYLNALIENSNLPNKLKKYKIYPLPKSFINSTKNKENCNFLLFTIKDIFFIKRKN